MNSQRIHTLQSEVKKRLFKRYLLVLLAMVLAFILSLLFHVENYTPPFFVLVVIFGLGVFVGFVGGIELIAVQNIDEAIQALAQKSIETHLNRQDANPELCTHSEPSKQPEE